MSSSFSPPNIAQVELGCTDLDVAQDFYCERLGLKLVGRFDNSIFVRCGEVNLIVQQSPNPKPARCVYFSADGCINEATRDLKEKGVAFTQEPRCIARGHEGFDVWLGFFNDPSGNQLALLSNMPMTS